MAFILAPPVWAPFLFSKQLSVGAQNQGSEQILWSHWSKLQCLLTTKSLERVCVQLKKSFQENRARADLGRHTRVAVINNNGERGEQPSRQGKRQSEECGDSAVTESLDYHSSVWSLHWYQNEWNLFSQRSLSTSLTVSLGLAGTCDRHCSDNWCQTNVSCLSPMEEQHHRGINSLHPLPTGGNGTILCFHCEKNLG